MDPDLSLLDRWCAGEAQAGNELFQRHFTSVYEFFVNKVGDEADELVQETFLACTKSRDKFQRRSTFRTYVFAIARFKLYEYFRKRSKDRDCLDFSHSSLEDLRTTPRTRISKNEEREQLLRALASLPPEQQLILELHYWQELSGDQLADVFDIAPATTRSRLFRARKALREKLKTPDQRNDADFHDWIQTLQEDSCRQRRSPEPSG